MSADVSRILREIESGDPASAEQLLPAVYDELRTLAARRLARERPGTTLQATALVHEAYLRLAADDSRRGAKRWDGAAHFFAAAAEAMRRILVERARERATRKRGGGRRWVALQEDARVADVLLPDELLDLDAALGRLAADEPRKSRLVVLRFFAGLTLEEAAAVLSISIATAQRDWAYARAWLLVELNRGMLDEESSEL